MTARKSHDAKSGGRRGARLPERDAPVPALRAIKPRDYGTTKEVVHRAFDQAGGAETVQALLGRSQSTVYGYSDPASARNELTLDQARRMTRFAGVTVFAEDLAGLADGAFLPAPSRDAPSWARIGALAGKEMAEFEGRLIQALASSGEIDARERRDLNADLDAVLRTLLGARAKLNGGGE